METKYIVNNLSGQTINGEPILRPYKVFTALLTQSGEDNSIGVSGEGGTVTIGTTYLINENPDNDDLTIYGAPNNDVGTYFVANQTGILNYTDSLQLIYNGGAPVVTVLENTIGNVWFTYEGTGGYYINSDGLFVDGKTFVIIGDSYDGGVNGAIIASYFQSLYITISTAIIDFNINAIVGSDGLLFKTPIEIRVYN